MHSLETMCSLREALAAEAASDSIMSGIMPSSRIEGANAVHELASRLSQDAAERLYVPPLARSSLFITPVFSTHVFIGCLVPWLNEFCF